MNGWSGKRANLGVTCISVSVIIIIILHHCREEHSIHCMAERTLAWSTGEARERQRKGDWPHVLLGGHSMHGM
jgi:hypothetical protein